MTLALMVGFAWPIFNAIAAGAYTITYVDGNGTVLATDSANAGDTVNLADYPSGAIAWVNDNGSASAPWGTGYINYNLSNPAPNTTQPFTMTMPAQNVILKAFYGDYSSEKNQPRLIQFHLTLSYHDVNSGCDLYFPDQYQNINAPAGYNINLPGPDYFQPMSVTASNCNDPALDGVHTSGLQVDQWVKDASYTGSTTPPAGALYDPNQSIYVDPNDYNQIYNVMVDQNLDWITGEPTPPPTTPIDPSNPPVTPVFSAVSFCLDEDIWTSQADDTSLGDISSINGRFDYDFGGVTVLGGPGSVTGSPCISDSGVLAGVTWGDWFGSVGAVGNTPTPFNVADYTWWWTDQNDNIVNLSRISSNFIIPEAGLTYTLHYAANPAPLPQIVVRFNTDSQVWDGNQHSVSGFTVISFDGSQVSLSGGESSPVELPNGQWLSLESDVFGIDTVYGTNVGTYPLFTSPLDFVVYSSNPASGGVPIGGYQVVVQAGGLTITPVFNEISPPDSCTNGATNFPACDNNGGTGGGDGSETPDAPNTGNGIMDKINIGLLISVVLLSGATLLFISVRNLQKNTK